ncbi:hypothetical protein TNCV_5112951 [Trichonephila clavipes]|nr:hypothetical protein TNCV_5112951 [Trichonephila clavipes]
MRFAIPFDKLQKPFQEKFRALHFEEAFNDLFNFSIASIAPSGEILFQSQKQMKVTWCEIRTGGGCRRSQTRVSCNMVLHCRSRMWSHIVTSTTESQICETQVTFSESPLSISIRVPQYRVGTVTIWFQSHKSPLKSERFFRMQSSESSLKGFLKLIKRYDKCLNVLGTYVEKHSYVLSLMSHSVS